MSGLYSPALMARLSGSARCTTIAPATTSATLPVRSLRTRGWASSGIMIEPVMVSVKLDVSDWWGIIDDLEGISSDMQMYVDHGISKYDYRQKAYRALIESIKGQLKLANEDV